VDSEAVNSPPRHNSTIRNKIAVNVVNPAGATPYRQYRYCPTGTIPWNHNFTKCI